MPQLKRAVLAGVQPSVLHLPAFFHTQYLCTFKRQGIAGQRIMVSRRAPALYVLALEIRGSSRRAGLGSEAVKRGRPHGLGVGRGAAQGVRSETAQHQLKALALVATSDAQSRR